MNERPLPTTGAAIWPTLLQTPLGDLLRGRLTGKLGIGAILSEAALPEPVSELIRNVARRTRLWRAERVDVARELIEHFRDGLTAGRTAEQLVESFGDAKQASRLIRRAKLRARPLFWRVWRRAVQGLAGIAALMVGCYLFLAIRLFAHHPTVAHNYSLDLIAPTEGVPEADRAWPFYREALLHQTPAPVVADESNLQPGESIEAGPRPDQPLVPLDYLAEKPGSKHWAKVERWLDENKVTLESTRQGAARAHFGFVYGDPADRAWLESEKIDPESMDPQRNEQIIAFMLPQQQAIRHLGQMLEADARRALDAGDRKTFLAEVDSLIKIAEQLEGDLAFLVVDLISYNTFERGLSLVDKALTEYPDVLQDGDLAHLAHRIASYAGGGQIVPRLAGERADFHDLIQRTYSDNGHGDGVLTHAGLRLLESLWSLEVGQLTREHLVVLAACVPVAGGSFPGREEITKRGDVLYDRAEAEFERPLWQWSEEGYEQALRQLSQSTLDRIRYAPLLILMPSIEGCYYRAQWLTQERDATLVELALTLFHRRHAAWPERLDELVPDLLPAVPPDRFTGEPIRYRVMDGGPVVYSVGPDKQDNGGQPPDVSPEERANIYRSCTHPRISPPKLEDAWDWVLWQPESPSTAGAE